MSIKKVVITGYGAVSPFGVGVQIMLDNLLSGNSAVVNMKNEWKNEVEDLYSWVGAPLQEDLNDKSIPRKFRKNMGKTAIMSYIAAREAIELAEISEDILKSGRMGVSFGSSTGSVASTEYFLRTQFEHQSTRKLASGVFFQIMSHTSAANIAQGFNIRGRVISPNCACSSATQGIGLGFEAIRNGQQDIMLCGGSDELHVMTNASFDIVQAASCRFNDTPKLTPRPFDKDRDGTVCADGAGCVILESEESAIARNAEILGEIIGFSTSSSGKYITHSDVDSIIKCMNHAIEDANITSENIDYINAHATGTQVGDISEAVAIEHVFGLKTVPVSSFKGHLGHTLGASGALELIACFNMINQGKIIPTKNLDKPDEKCAGLNHIKKIYDAKVELFIKNSFAFGGINTVLIGKRYNYE